MPYGFSSTSLGQESHVRLWNLPQKHQALCCADSVTGGEISLGLFYQGNMYVLRAVAIELIIQVLWLISQ